MNVDRFCRRLIHLLEGCVEDLAQACVDAELRVDLEGSVKRAGVRIEATVVVIKLGNPRRVQYPLPKLWIAGQRCVIA